MRFTGVDLIAFLQDAFGATDDTNITLTPAGRDGLKYILGAIENALRFVAEERRGPAAGEETTS